MVKISKGQDEVSGLNGPHEEIDDSVLIEKDKIEEFNSEINKSYNIQVYYLILLVISFRKS